MQPQFDPPTCDRFLLLIIIIFFSFCSCEIRSRAKAREGTYPGCHATEHTKSWSPASAHHRTRRSATFAGFRSTSPYGNLRIHKRKSDVDAPPSPRVSRLLNANTCKFPIYVFIIWLCSCKI